MTKSVISTKAGARARPGRLGRQPPIVLKVGATLALLAGLWLYTAPGPQTSLDNWFYDTLVRLQIDGRVPDRVVIVDIDEISLTTVGQWPWPRYRMAALVKELASARPAVIGFDVLFAEPDRTSLSTIKETFQKEFNLELGYTGLPPGLDDNDGYLGYVLQQTRAVGAVFFYFDLQGSEPVCPLIPLKITAGAERIFIPKTTGLLCNTPKVQKGFATCGFINTVKDPDGVLRRMSTVMTHQGKIYPGFSLAAFCVKSGLYSAHIESDFFGPVMCLGDTRIPIDANGNCLIQFRGRAGSHRFISALDILTGKWDPTRVADRIVLVGSTAVGLNDLHHTAVDAELSGTEAHAVFLDNAFSNTFNRQPYWTGTYTLITTLLAGIAIPVLFTFVGPISAAAGTVGVSLLFLGLSFSLYFTKGVFLPASGPVLTAGVQLAILSLLLYAVEKHRALIRLRRLVRVQQLTLESMAAVAETRDLESGQHIKRTQHYVKVLAEALSETGNYPFLTLDYIDLLFHSAPLHDIGKVGIPDAILFSAGALTPEQFNIMKLHTLYGKKIIETAARGSDEHEFLELAGEIALTHHEKWNGSGYPSGLSGEAIPLSGRIMAVADVYDALVTRRRYKPALTHEEAKGIITKNRGSHFDPAVVEAFLTTEEKFVSISKELQENDESGREYL